MLGLSKRVFESLESVERERSHIHSHRAPEEKSSEL